MSGGSLERSFSPRREEDFPLLARLAICTVAITEAMGARFFVPRSGKEMSPT